MATNPHGTAAPVRQRADWQYGYFNECMSGFEHQAASHMIAEGLVTGGAGRHPRHPRPLPRRPAATPTTRSSAATTTRARWRVTARSSRSAASSTTARKGISASRRASPRRISARLHRRRRLGDIFAAGDGDDMEASVVLATGGCVSTLAMSPPPGVSAAKVTVTLAGKRLAATHTTQPDGRVLRAPSAGDGGCGADSERPSRPRLKSD